MTVLFIFIFITTFMLTGFIRHYALAQNILDIPNHRSSHSLPTPRGGGIAFVIVFLLCTALLNYLRYVNHWTATGFIVGGLFVACLGFLDDLTPVSAIKRLACHFIVSALTLFCLGGLPAITLLGFTPDLNNLLLNTLAVLYLVWFLNLYNFMDGIDGLAAVEAVSICLGGVLIYFLQNESTYIFLPLVLAFSVTGFLCWNFPIARIFMGDAGSGFLGLIIGLLSIQASHVHPELFWSWLILAGVFIVDATVTLIRRSLAGEKFYEAHRTHGYQHAKDLLKKHFNVTIGILAINIIWLLPLAALVGSRCLDGFTGLLIAYIPLVVLALQFRSGCNHSSY